MRTTIIGRFCAKCQAIYPIGAKHDFTHKNIK